MLGPNAFEPEISQALNCPDDRGKSSGEPNDPVVTVPGTFNVLGAYNVIARLISVSESALTGKARAGSPIDLLSSESDCLYLLAYPIWPIDESSGK
jgi:hypothetical protein